MRRRKIDVEELLVADAEIATPAREGAGPGKRYATWALDPPSTACVCPSALSGQAEAAWPGLARGATCDSYVMMTFPACQCPPARRAGASPLPAELGVAIWPCRVTADWSQLPLSKHHAAAYHGQWQETEGHGTVTGRANQRRATSTARTKTRVY